MTGSNQQDRGIDPIAKSREILKNYPLCDHCLGRLFAKMGLELGNDERGKAIKTLLSMHLHVDHRNGNISREELKRYAINAGDPITRLYSKIYNEEVKTNKCYICENKINRQYFNKHAEEIYKILKEYDASTFLIGVSLPQDVSLRELEVASNLNLETSESIKNEIKREVGKIIKNKYGLEPDFTYPDVVVVINYSNERYNIVVNPLLFHGVYWKRGRNISHTVWIGRRGVKEYPYSIEEFLNDNLNKLFNSEKIVHHASGREDVDARMLGTGRPLVVEIKKPRRRKVTLEELNKILHKQLIEVCLTGKSSHSIIEYLKGEGSKKIKIYKLLFYTEKPIEESIIKRIELEFKNRIINQRTPTRILRRKKDYLRKRRVYELKVRKIHDQVYEAIIKCDGGLYVKELVHCDNGRTSPCFSEILGARAYPLELDVIGIEIDDYINVEKCYEYTLKS